MEIVEEVHENYLISTEKKRLQIKRVHHFLSQESYWCVGIPEEVVCRAVENSICFGIYDLSHQEVIQVGFSRIVTDYATFAWVCDVYVEKEHRARGLSKKMVEMIVAHPQLQGLRRICLATVSAHKLYEKFGFQVTQTPQSWMEIKDNDIYKKMCTG